MQSSAHACIAFHFSSLLDCQPKANRSVGGETTGVGFRLEKLIDLIVFNLSTFSSYSFECLRIIPLMLHKRNAYYALMCERLGTLRREYLFSCLRFRRMFNGLFAAGFHLSVGRAFKSRINDDRLFADQHLINKFN